MSGPKLGQVLLARRVIGHEQLEEGLDSQIINGGRLGTNLVELGLLSETELAEALQTQHNLPAAHGELSPKPEALELIKGEWCDRHNLLPLRVEGDRLYLGVTTPYPAEQAAELGRRLGKTLQQMIIPEFRMNQLLRRYTKAFRPVRPVDLRYASKVADAAATGGASSESTELMSEEEFQSLYANALSGGRTGSLEEAHAEEVLEPEPLPPEPQAPPAALPQPALPIFSLPSLPAIQAQDGPLERRDPASKPVPQEQDRRNRVPAPPPAPLLPITFAEAQAELQKTEDRNGIARVVMRFASTKFKRALLLTLQGQVAVGWEGAGEGLTGSRAKRIAVPLGAGSPFKLVRDSRSHFLGPLRRDASIAAFFRLIGGPAQTSILMPVLAGGRVVNILYCDSGPDRPSTPDIGELLILSQKVGRSYEAMIAKRKKVAASEATRPG